MSPDTAVPVVPLVPVAVTVKWYVLAAVPHGTANVSVEVPVEFDPDGVTPVTGLLVNVATKPAGRVGLLPAVTARSAVPPSALNVVVIV